VFERFTDRARRVVVLAQEEARMLSHNYIGTEHILLGLIREGEGVAAQVLESLGISLEAGRSQVEEIIGQGQAAPTGHIPFTTRAKKVLELSLREALQLGHNYIGTEHILLGLIREGEGVAAQVLQNLGADLDRVRQTVILLLAGEGAIGEASEEKTGFFHEAESGDEARLLIGVRHEGVRVSSVASAEFVPDPERGGQTHRLRDGDGLKAGLWRLPQGAHSDPVTFTLAQTETILVLEGRVLIEVTDGPTFDLVAGDMASLDAGLETTWDVRPPFLGFWVRS
jgi:uncharacterized cupin superfamily protein